MKYIRKTNRLFYDKFVNKISFIMPLASLFRGKDFVAIKSMLAAYDDLISTSSLGYINIGKFYHRKIDVEGVIQSQNLLKILEDSSSEYNVRVEGNIISFYTNDDKLLDDLAKLAKDSIRYISKPENDNIRQYLLDNPASVIVKKPEHKYRIVLKTLGSDRAQSFTEWVYKMPKIKLGSKPATMRYREGHFYVVDDKTLSVCRLFLSDKISRIEHLVSKDEI
jgi:hypothetical protein